MFLIQQLQDIRQSLSFLTPELWLGACFVCLLLLEIILKNSRFSLQTDKILQISCGLATIVAGGLLWQQYGLERTEMFQTMLVLSPQAVYYKGIVVVATLLVLAHIGVTKHQLPSETYALFLSSLLGMFLMTMATHWLAVFLSVELLSISLYLLVAMPSGRLGAEGGVKYVLLGAISAAVMLYGISWLYGLTGTLVLSPLSQTDGNVALLVGFMALGGIFFKLSIVPFHLWTPDVYTATPTPVVAFVSTAPKAAALLVFMRISEVFSNQFQPIFMVLALASIFWGNLAAIRQTDFKRMMAYSSIAQLGFIMLGVAAYNAEGNTSATFYMTVYVLMNVTAFLLIDLLGNGHTDIETLAGLGTKRVWLGVALLIAMVSLVGLPPTAGFLAKLFVFSSLWSSYAVSKQALLLWALGLGLLNAAISLFYYLKLPFFLFFRENKNPPTTSNVTFLQYFLVCGLVLLLVFLFFMPNALTLHQIGF